MTDEDLTLLVLEAQRHERGCAVRTNAPEQLRQRLYKVMQKVGVTFTLTIPPKEGELWLIPKKS